MEEQGWLDGVRVLPHTTYVTVSYEWRTGWTVHTCLVFGGTVPPLQDTYERLSQEEAFDAAAAMLARAVGLEA